MEIKYVVDIIPPENRIEYISNLQEHSDKFYSFPHYKNEQVELKVVKLPIEVPIYRMENYRTKIAQQTYIKKHKKDVNFFSNGQENVSSQQIQHNMLVEYSQRGRGISVVPVYDVLESGRQQEPLLITFEGVVVNGNRRLSAMRELYKRGHEHYSHVDCMVLPRDATKDAIREVEFRLQMTPLTILPYEWLNEGYAVKDLISAGKDKAHVAKLMRRKPGMIDDLIMAVDQAELYLAEWVEAPGDYSHFDEEKDQMFMDIAKNLKGKEGEDLEASRSIAFLLADNSRNLGTRVYDYKGAFGASSTEVIERLAKRHDLNLESPTGSSDDNDVPGDFDFEIEEHETKKTYMPVIDLLKDKEKSEEIVKDITDIFDSIKSERDDIATGKNALNKIRDANTKLMEADITRADSSTYESILQQLLSIKEKVNSLESEVNLAIRGGREECE